MLLITPELNFISFIASKIKISWRSLLTNIEFTSGAKGLGLMLVNTFDCTTYCKNLSKNY